MNRPQDSEPPFPYEVEQVSYPEMSESLSGLRPPPRGGRLVRGVLVLMALILVACGGDPRGQGERRPNIVLVTLDTLRADALGPYRAGASLTPRIDEFAADSVVFEEAVTPIGTTFPAHASLFTSLYPRMHGVRWNGDALGAEFDTLAEKLSNAGYDTAAFVAMPSMLHRGGLGQGFQLQTPPSAGILSGAEVNRLALPWLREERSGERPLFLWAHYFEAHSPYDPGSHSKQRFADLHYEGPLRDGVSTDLFYSLGREIPWSHEDREALKVLYDQEIVRLDHHVGTLLDAVGALRSTRPTWIFLTADHGQALGERGDVGHGFLLWQTVLRVPLIIGGDAAEDLPGRSVRQRVSLLDLMPTALELAGLEPIADAAGRSLLGDLEGGVEGHRKLFAEVRVLADNKRHDPDDAKAVAVFDGPLKLIWRPDGSRFFDLSSDPAESLPVTQVPPERREAMDRLARNFAAHLGAITDWTDLDEGTARELRALGYL